MSISPATAHYVRLAEAAQLTGIKKSQLVAAIERGTLKAVEVDGELAVRPTDAMSNLPKNQRPEYKKFAHLRGKPLGIAEAARKYDLRQPTLSKWVKRGLVAKLGRDPHHSQKILVDEADVAYCATIHRLRPGPGNWLFNSDGTPYSPKGAAA